MGRGFGEKAGYSNNKATEQVEEHNVISDQRQKKAPNRVNEKEKQEPKIKSEVRFRTKAARETHRGRARWGC